MTWLYVTLSILAVYAAFVGLALLVGFWRMRKLDPYQPWKHR
mgnify:CR=1 FL=1